MDSEGTSGEVSGVFQRLRKAGLKLKPSKCTFFRNRIAYLGHIVSKEGIKVDPKKSLFGHIVSKEGIEADPKKI